MPPKAPRQRTLDLRGLMADGEYRLPLIMRSLEKLQAGETVRLVTPFLPSLLIVTLQSVGFAALPERRADGSWQTQFTRNRVAPLRNDEGTDLGVRPGKGAGGKEQAGSRRRGPSG